MPYDEELAARVRTALAGRDGVTERKMFGGLAFMLGGHMCCGVVKEDLVLRLGPAEAERALEEAHARPMDFTGKPLKGFVYVGPGGLETDGELRGWLERAAGLAASLPPK